MDYQGGIGFGGWLSTPFQIGATRAEKRWNKVCFIRTLKDTKNLMQKTILFSNKVTKLTLLAHAVARVSGKTRSWKMVGFAGTLYWLLALHILGIKTLMLPHFRNLQTTESCAPTHRNHRNRSILEDFNDLGIRTVSIPRVENTIFSADFR